MLSCFQSHRWDASHGLYVCRDSDQLRRVQQDVGLTLQVVIGCLCSRQLQHPLEGEN